MKICVCGWYFNPKFMAQLERVHRKYPVAVVSHKNVPINLPHCYRPNIGLEWGAYNHYLMNIWDGDKVFFTHDDNEVEDLGVFDEIAASDLDVGFVFRSEKEAKWTMDGHGRALLMSEKFMNHAKTTEYDLVISETKERYRQIGFWYDKRNVGTLSDHSEINCNEGILRFKTLMSQAKKKGFEYGNIYSDKLHLGYRGHNGIAELIHSIRGLKSPAVKWADARQGIF